MKYGAVLIFLGITKGMAQPAAPLPLTALAGTDMGKPLVLYITGDGGWNSFSTTLARSLNRQGFPLLGLDAKNYFWTRKTPQQAARDINGALAQYAKAWNRKEVVLLGYSLGADVLPFIQVLLPEVTVQLVKRTILLSPSAKTDFEVHIINMLGLTSGTMSVAGEINKLTRPVTLIFGGDENDFPAKAITLKGIHTVTLAGGHHYNGNVEEVMNTITAEMK